ncbi:XdhC family protein [Rhizobiaceae bacterium BDR2-2]|uniref:XdhC family protein n=1 Tax=Ectorhizobium quercum TaxID=2965071 RepID=A0AAE3N108_9HYPH|nr:XdhC family protein [Ectorhizobium quercum]MCX8997962.1 XdhC family protein [Ectorhizobium quercum]
MSGERMVGVAEMMPESGFRPQTDALSVAARWAAQGRRLALATVIETWGSAPRPAGSHMVVDADGNFEGSVSGGCVEGEVIAQAVDAITGDRALMLEFGVEDETAWRAGLACGGRIRVRLERPAFDLSALEAARRDRRAVVVATALEDGQARLLPLAEAAAMVSPETAEALCRFGKAVLAETADGRALFLNPYLPAPEIVVIGAVQIAQSLAALAGVAGYDLRIVDPRSGFAAPERFPGIALETGWPEEVFAARPAGACDALVALSHDPRIDDDALVAALGAGCFYVGALGSRKTHAKRLERLKAAGLDEAVLSRIAAPVGLDIGAVTPAEIALAILAEIVCARRKGAVPPRRTAKA